MRQLEQCVDYLSHPDGRSLNAGEVRLRGARQLVPAIVQKSLTEAADRPHRGAQIVGHGISQRFPFAILGLQLPVLDAIKRIAVRGSVLCLRRCEKVFHDADSKIRAPQLSYRRGRWKTL